MFNTKRLFIILAALFGILLIGGGIIAGDAGRILLAILVIGLLLAAIPLMKSVTNGQVARALRGLDEDEDVRYQYTAPFVGIGEKYVIVTTKRIILAPTLSRRNGSIPFDQIYMANTGGRSLGVGMYGHGLMVGSALTDNFLELDLTNDDVVRIRVRRPHVSQQRLTDAYIEWAERQ